ncbi:MAG TPA: TonB-dependent receptor [Bryobacteraceae bacterium]|nr:TonB-dependent receptor [Bryobacteraceae bacterium]
MYRTAPVLALAAAAAIAQVTTTGIHGVVRDPSGAVVPNAAVTATDTGTGIEKKTTTAQDGAFIYQNLQAATYKVSVSAPGFQTLVLQTVVVDTGRVTDVPVQLAVGAAATSVEVTAATAQLETTSNEVGTTINNKNIQNLPYSSLDSLNFALLMAGSQSGTGGSTFNGLPNASLNITIDGMDNNSERFKSGGTSFYAFAPERINSTEEVTVSTTGMGAESAGMGAMNIRFTTKRGTDQYHFSIGEQFANEDLNANLFFANLRGQPISKSRQNNAYGGIGGPLIPFSNKWKHKLFFYAYMEAQPQPGTTTLTTHVLSSGAAQGLFTYNGTDGATHTVNLLQTAGAAGFTSSIDPTAGSMLNAIASSESNASGFLPITGQPYWQTMEWTQSTNSLQLFPSARVDYHITPSIAWHGSWNLRYYNITGSQPPYPGETQYAFNNAYKITAYVATTGLDWTITPQLINSFNFGVQSNGEYFYAGANPQQWAPYGNRALYSPLINSTIPNPIAANVLPFIRNNPVYQVRDDVTWSKGKHTITMGGILKATNFWETSYGTAGVPTYTLGIASGDPVVTALTAGLPGINTGNGDLTNAENLYALLTGRVSTISGNVNVDEHTHAYTPYQPETQRWSFKTGGLYLQDNFRATSHLTLNFGIRFEFDGAIQSTNGINGEPTASSFYGPSNYLFQPGVLSGNQNPTYNLVQAPYKSDLLNPAPNFGFAWNPAPKGGLGAKLLGNGKTVIRGGFSMTYYNEGMNTISNTITNNPGSTQSISANPGGPGFPLGGLNLSSPAPPLSAFPATFGFPFPESQFALAGGQSLGYVNPDLVSPYVTNWNFGVQRELGSGFVFEARYIGNKTTHAWHYQNMNEANIFENGFLPQFQQAQANLTINQANGKGTTFANSGLPGQGALPIFDAAFGANGSFTPLAASSGYTNSTFITDLQQGLAGTMAGSLASTSSTSPGYYCRLVGSNFGPCASAGFTTKTNYPLNFWTPNPYATSLYYLTDNGDNNYNGMQLELRKAFGHGLSFTGNFTWSHTLGDLLNSNDQTATYQWVTQRNARLSYGPSPFDHRMAWNSFWTYDLPFGKGRWVNLNNGIMDRVLGGWTLGGVEQIATGAPAILNSQRLTVNNRAQVSNTNYGGVAFGSGLTPSQLQQDLSMIPNMNTVVGGNLISNVGSIAQSNGIANPAYYGPNTTAGSFGQMIYLYGNSTFTLNMSLNKSVRIRERLNIGFRVEALNFLNHPFFSLGSTSSTANTFGQVSSTSGTRTVLLRAFLNW